MKQNTIKRLLNAWEINELIAWELNDGVDQSMLTNFDGIEITELDSNDEAVLYQIKGQDKEYDYCTTIVTYGETDLFAMSDWQDGIYPKTIKLFSYNHITKPHHHTMSVEQFKKEVDLVLS